MCIPCPASRTTGSERVYVLMLYVFSNSYFYVHLYHSSFFPQLCTPAVALTRVIKSIHNDLKRKDRFSFVNPSNGTTYGLHSHEEIRRIVEPQDRQNMMQERRPDDSDINR